MIAFHAKCPHCGTLQLVDEGAAVDRFTAAHVLPTDRELQLRQAQAPKGQVEERAHYDVRCDGCGVAFVVHFEVRERPRIAVLSSVEIGRVIQIGKKNAPRVQAAKRLVCETPPPIACPGCLREYGEDGAGYPDPMPIEGLCPVCSQEAKRILATRKGTP